MEFSFPSDTPASQDLSSITESFTTQNIPTCNSSGDLSMNDMKMCLNEFLRIEDTSKTTSDLSAGNNNKCDMVIEDECKDSDESSYDLPESTSFVKGMLFGEKGREDDRTSEANGSVKSVDEYYPPPKSLATPLKLASAMKGSREKQGILSPKLSVTWSPDVYDPIPTSVSHVPSSRNQQYRNKSRKYGKNKQKGSGKSERGGKGKDKKQARKNGGNTSPAPKFKAVHDDNVASISEPHAGIIDFNGVSTDPFCGSSFLKNSVNDLHFPVAEATR